jgi:acetyltransferase-like isoleucine patch superfamily enzyme
VVIAANSVVSGFIPPYAIAAGSPAKVIKYRLDPSTIEKLQATEWWLWDQEN